MMNLLTILLVLFGFWGCIYLLLVLATMTIDLLDRPAILNIPSYQYGDF